MELEERICEFEAALDCTITVHDFILAFSLRGERLIGQDRGSHRQHYAVCAGENRDYCVNHCMFELNARIEASGCRCCLKHCRNRRVEVVAPLWRNGNHVVTVFAGMWKAPCDRERIRSLCSILPLWAEGLLRCAEEIRELEAGEQGTLRRRIETFLERNYRREVTLNMLAGELSLSEFRTSHLVSRTFGRSFRELLTAERIKHARLYLARGDFRVGEVARLCGFNSPEHFSRLFKRETGISPAGFHGR